MNVVLEDDLGDFQSLIVKPLLAIAITATCHLPTVNVRHPDRNLYSPPLESLPIVQSCCQNVRQCTVLALTAVVIRYYQPVSRGPDKV